MRKSLASLVFVVWTVMALAASVRIGALQVNVVTDPPLLPVGRANLLITVTDSAGKPVEDAEVRAIARMPGMNMGEREQAGRPGDQPGVYVVPATFPMGGLYEVAVTVNGQTGAVEFRTGETTTRAGRRSVWPLVLGGLALIGAIAFVVVRMRQTGQSLRVKGAFSGSVVSSLLVLAAAVAVAVWAVGTQRREGAMTPIEAQVMEMNMPAPEGVLPVRLARAERRPFGASVSYTGQAVGFTEQDVTPRVSGAIRWMPLYVGDSVRKGQLLARLDTSQLEPEVAMRSAAVGRAQQGAGVANFEYQEAVNEAQAARAEVAMAQGEHAEAEAMLDAAVQGRASAEADLQAARAEVEAMRAELAAAEADRSYMRAELERTQELASKGAASRAELQRAQADADKAEAMVRQAGERVTKAQTMATSAGAMQRRVEAEIAAARRKVQQAEAAVRAREAMVRKAEAGARAARARIGQEQAMVRESAAALKGAQTQQGYASLRAETDGVVTQRLVSPGQVVQAGQAVLRVAQVRPIRLQANVPERELARIRVGGTVRVARRGAEEEPLALRVTSVAPAVDPTSRTGVVEAVYANEDDRFRPGEYLKMEISLGDPAPAVVVAWSAVVRESQTSDGVLADGERAFVWIAEVGMNGEYVVKRQEVKLGARAEDAVSIREGLDGGEWVVVAPPQGLRDGTRVVDAGAGGMAEAEQSPTIIVTDRGYEPSEVVIPANKPVTITFLRKAESTCGETLVFPQLKIEKTLPLNQPVKVELPSQPPGTLKFACGMDMLRGKVVAR